MFYRNPPPPQGPMGWGRGYNPGYQQPQGIQKFLAPFLNRGGARSYGDASRFSGGSFMNAFPPTAAAQTAAGGSNWLGHLQGALKAVQSAAPMVQQYGPMVKNIPAMINMMKLMNESDEETNDKEDSEDLASKSKSGSESESVDQEKTKARKRQGTSQPKLYI